jgi:hypothetical protein
MPRYQLVNVDGEHLGDVQYATHIHEGDLIHWPRTEKLRVVAVAYDAEAEREVLTVEPE